MALKQRIRSFIEKQNNGYLGSINKMMKPFLKIYWRQIQYIMIY